MKARIPKEVFDKMTKEENSQLVMLSMNGVMQSDGKGNTTILMGSKAFKLLTDFEDKMIEKYGHKTDIT